MISYFFVGLGAAITEWVVFYLLDEKVGFHYAVATSLAYILSTFVNWLLGRLITFRKSGIGIIKELVGVYLASAVGLIINIVLMFALVDLLHINEIMSKIISTGIVFFWNFYIRKKVIYKTR